MHLARSFKSGASDFFIQLYAIFDKIHRCIFLQEEVCEEHDSQVRQKTRMFAI